MPPRIGFALHATDDGYDATTAGFAMSPAGPLTIIEVPIVGYVMPKGADLRRLIVMRILIIASGIFWMSSLNLNVAERDLVIPRIVRYSESDL